jgi:hypothetical protein
MGPLNLRKFFHSLDHTKLVVNYVQNQENSPPVIGYEDNEKIKKLKTV